MQQKIDYDPIKEVYNLESLKEVIKNNDLVVVLFYKEQQVTWWEDPLFDSMAEDKINQLVIIKFNINSCKNINIQICISLYKDQVEVERIRIDKASPKNIGKKIKLFDDLL